MRREDAEAVAFEGGEPARGLVAGLIDQVAALRAEVDELKRVAGRSSKNSSMAPSSDPPKSRAERRREAGLGRVEQRRAAELYARGLIEAGARKSLEPIVARLGGGAVEYEALQHFLADSPWDPAVVDRAVAERVCAAIEPEAWVLDDTGVPKDGKHSPGVKRQYSGTLGKIGSCQIAVSLHAVGRKGTVPLGFRLYLPEEWCADRERRRKAKIPDGVEFATKPALGGELVCRAAGWKVRRAPVLGDQAYGNDSKLRARLHDDAVDYVLSVGPESEVFDLDWTSPASTDTVGLSGSYSFLFWEGDASREAASPVLHGLRVLVS